MVHDSCTGNPLGISATKMEYSNCGEFRYTEWAIGLYNFQCDDNVQVLYIVLIKTYNW